MARRKSFSPREALDAAVEVFTRNGFEGTSTAQLTDALGIAKQSLYDTFGSKRELFCESIDHAAEGFTPARWLFNEGLSGRRRIERFFDAVVDDCVDPKRRGCLVTHALLESEGYDDELRAKLAAKACATQAALRQAVETGQRDGSIATTRSAEALGWALMNLLAGLRVTARLAPDRAHLEALTGATLAMLD